MARDFRRLSALAAALCVAPMLGASGFQLREQNPAGQGNSFAGATAGYGGLGSLFFNPAAMVPVDGMQFLAGLSHVAPRAELNGAVGSRSAALPAPVRPISGPGTHGDAAHNAVLPNLYAVWSVGQNLRLGVSVNAPYGLVTEYNPDFVGRYHALKSDLKTVDLGFSAAYKLSDQWAVGATLLYRKAEAELTTGVDWGLALVPYGTVPGTLDGTASLKGSKTALGYKLGVLYSPSADLRLGVSHHGAMTMELKGDAIYQFPSTMPAPFAAGLAAKGYRSGEGKADLKLPASTSVGLDWKVNDVVSIQGEASLTQWSTFQELRVRFSTGLADNITQEQWKDAWFYSLGATWKATDALVLRTGLAFDQAAVENIHRTPRIPDCDRTWISVGASWAANRSLTLDFGYSHIMVKEGTLNLSAGVNSTSQDFARGNLTGTYKSGIEVLSLGARFSF